MASVLYAEKWPYIVTLLITAVGWAITHTADRLMKTPTIEYSTRIDETRAQPAARKFTVEIFNLADSAIVKPRLILRKKDTKADVRFNQGEIVTGLPSWVGVNSPNTTSDAIVFLLDVLPPSASAELVGTFEGHDTPVFQFQMATANEGAFRTMERGLTTWAVRHELVLIWAGLGFWLAVMVTWACLGRSP